MDCETIHDQLSGLRDGALDEETALVIEAHLADCELCRAQQDALTALDASLSRAFASERRGAERVAAGVIEQLTATTATRMSQPDAPAHMGRRALGYLIAVAAGFLMAVLCFPPWERPSATDELTFATDPAARITHRSPPVDQTLPVPAAVVAQLVHTTGPISYRPPSGTEWEQVDPALLQVFCCPSDSSVRTARGALAELKTPGGSRIRLNESSEVSFVSDQELQLMQGQIWCRASDDADLRVVAGAAATASEPPPVTTFSCPRGVGCVTSSAPTQPLQVATASGRVDVSAGGESKTLSAGTVATLANGRLEVTESPGELIHAQRWMQPLLTLRGHGNPELTERVDALLAGIGRTKLAHLYEQDLRHLGEYAALPLLRFVQSEPSRAEPDRRQTAMDILADTAPIWMVPDLIALLEDDEPAIRVASARGLMRLTGTDQGMTPDQWDGDPAELIEGRQRWQAWWKQHRFACASPPTTVPEWDQLH